jgi:hypothetical protein
MLVQRCIGRGGTTDRMRILGDVIMPVGMRWCMPAMAMHMTVPDGNGDG